MPDKPRTAADYSPAQVDLVRATCLYVATRLGDLRDDLVVVGGLVPSLLVDQRVEPHVGTLDLDMGLAVALLEEGRYHTLTERLRAAGLSPDLSPDGNPTRQRWTVGHRERVTVDFLIAPSRPADRGGRLRNIEPDFAAVIARGLDLAFRDRVEVVLTGRTLFGEDASRAVWVAGPGAYVVLKALAFHDRGENKDAYDLYYVLRHFGGGVDDVASHLRALAVDASAAEALAVLRRDFLDHDALGPRRVASFLTGGPNAEVQGDVAGWVRALLAALSKA